MTDRKITGFHLDKHGQWIAELACGHEQYVRHAPPYINRYWVTTSAGRRNALGRALTCRKCLAMGDSLPMQPQSPPKASVTTMTRSQTRVLAFYDKRADVLHVCRGKPQPGRSDEHEGILFRYAVADGKPCGVTVIGFLQDGWDHKTRRLIHLISAHLKEPADKVERAIQKVAEQYYQAYTPASAHAMRRAKY